MPCAAGLFVFPHNSPPFPGNLPRRRLACAKERKDTTDMEHSDCPATQAAPPPRTGARVSLPDPSALLKTKIHLALNRVMAVYLSHLEQLADEHDEAMRKLMDTLPEGERAKVHLADIYGEARFDAIRRYVLKAGNDADRDLGEAVDFLRLS